MVEQMTEYTIHVESPQLEIGGRELDLAQTSLNGADPEAGAACFLDTLRGVLSATMQVQGQGPGNAEDRARELFSSALEAAGVDLNSSPSRIRLEIEGPPDGSAASS